MTQEEKQLLLKVLCAMLLTDMLTLANESKMFDWLNAHHFDYRGLIEMGLALEATKECITFNKDYGTHRQSRCCGGN